MKFDDFLKKVSDVDGISDIHLKVGTPPVLRRDGTLIFAPLSPLTRPALDEILSGLVTEEQLREFEAKSELDFAISFEGIGRCRVNLYKEKGNPAIAMRFVPEHIKSTEELKLSPILKEWALSPRGLILCTGTAGSGKSTTIAAMLNYVNQNVEKNIITVEDPIEFIFKDNKSIISQREVGIDTVSFNEALRRVFREDPDIIYVGEIRDFETMDMCLKVADTGHLVVSTLHTLNATETINRIISFFPSHQHEHIRTLLAATLVGVISLRLLPYKDGKGRVPACEIMVCTEIMKKYILEGKTELIPKAIEDGMLYYHMQTFDQSIMLLYKNGLISQETAFRSVTNVDEFERQLKGIKDFKP
ncbi:MAG: PilT/PilU family type 4a pilus ATPase [Candidatus Stahlbacteria bacterium]|nr:PilT/PilU family type 4a pilus ATPase [Candidatus Stahlbacteria bacterium]